MSFRPGTALRPGVALATLVAAALSLFGTPTSPASFADARAQQRGLAGGKLLLENDRVVVVEGTVAPGEVSGMHKHALPAVVICVDGATLKETLPDGSSRTYERKAGEAAWRDKDFEHGEANVGQTRLRVIAVQLKP